MIRITKDGRTIRTGKHYTAFRAGVYERNGHCCEGCHRYLMFPEMEVHHIYGRGGGKRNDIPLMVRGLCSACHQQAVIKRREPVGEITS